MASTDAAERQQRVMRALVTEIRQQFETPVVALIELTKFLREDLDQHGASDLREDLDRVLDAARQLRKLVGEMGRVGEEAAGLSADELADLQRRLRHDLRTPLNAVKGYTEMLRDDAEDRGLDKLVGEFGGILSAADHLLGQIDTIVRFSGSSDGGDATQTQAADLAQALVDSIQALDTDAQPHVSTPASILVVDDNPDNREVLMRRLDREGHHATPAAGGHEALSMLERDTYDLVLLDLLMPDLNGFQVLSRMKRDARFRDIPVIMISALSESDSIIRCIEVGAEDYLTKPFDPILLRARIGSSLEKKRLREQEQQMMRRELEMAAIIQRSLFPPSPPPDSPIDGVNRPYRHVSGDFFDFFSRPDGLVPFALGDVSGKGVDAALLMARIASLFRYLGKTRDDPAEMLEILNREFHETSSYGRFVTAVVGLYDPKTGRVRFANAGHVPPVWVQSDHGHRTFEAPSPPLGILPDMMYATEEVSLDGGSFYVFTDGLIECRKDDGTSDELGLEGLVELLQGVAGSPPGGQLRTLVDRLDQIGWICRDDLTVLVIAHRPEGNL